MIKAVLFDLDGVLVDAVKIHERAFIAAVYTITGMLIDSQTHAETFNGLPTSIKLDMLEANSMIKRQDRDSINHIKQSITKLLINELLQTDPVKIRLLESLLHKNIQIGCVTNCSPETATLMLSNAGLISYIHLLIHNGSIDHPKPDPEGYLKALRLLGVEAKDTLIVEDSPKGIQAANATGAKVLQVSGPEDVTWEKISKLL
jgi:beta-phosphoglucomutase